VWHGECVATDEHPNLRRARFEALARDELVEPLRRYLVRRTDPETADRVLAETLLVCWDRFDQAPEPALPWAYGLAHRALPAAAPAPVAHPDDPVHETLARIDGADAEVLRLWAWEGLDPTGIGTVLATTPEEADARLRAARDAFDAELRRREGSGRTGEAS